MLIGITGLAGAGKDTAAEIIKSVDPRYKIIHFADPLKEMCVKYFGLTEEDVYTREGKAKFNEFWNMTNREILQKIGTDAMRNGFKKDVWCKLTELIIIKSGCKHIVIPDVRFDDEATMIKKHGGVIIKVIRDNNELNANECVHQSEKGIDETLVDFIIDNNYSIELLRDNIVSYCF